MLTAILLSSFLRVCLPSAVGGTILSGAGSTFAHPIYGRWITEFQRLEPNTEIHYEPIGSGAGIKSILQGTVDFAASDGPMSDTELENYRKIHGNEILHFPAALGAVVPTYNVLGLKAALRFTAQVLADIYLGRVHRWDDPALVKLNPEAGLPAQDIVVIYRSDGSGTTYVWTNYLSKTVPAWREQVGFGTTVDWPVGWGAAGNKGVIDVIQRTPYTIAYAELTFAILSNLSYGAVENSAGKFVKADFKSVASAAEATIDSMPADYRLSITNAPGNDSYPIASYTWLLIPSHFADSAKKESVQKFLRWALTQGQAIALSANYVPLPAQLATEEKQSIEQIK